MIDNEATMDGVNMDSIEECPQPVKQYASDPGLAHPTPPRKSRRQGRRLSNDRADHKAKTKATGGRKPLQTLPNEQLGRKPSVQTARSKQMSMQLNLNLDVEVQLKVTLHGELTLSLLN